MALKFDCRPGCAACCVVPSISSSIPGMAHGKPAFTRCAQLSPGNRCLLFGHPGRPLVCSSLQPTMEMCGETDEDAFARLTELELFTRP